MADPRLLYGLLLQKGYNPIQAAGILGNLKAESNLNTSIVGDKGTSFGLAQWHGPRWTALNRHAEGLGLSPASPAAQVSYLDYELRNKEPMAFRALQSARTPQEAAAAMLHFERPAGYSPNNPLASMHSDRRIANAVNMYGMLSGSPPMDTSPGAMAPQGFVPTPPHRPSDIGPPMDANPMIASDAPNAGIGGDMAGGMGQGQGMPDYMSQIGKFAGMMGGGGGGEQPLRRANIEHFSMVQDPLQGATGQAQPVQMTGFGKKRRGLLAGMGA